MKLTKILAKSALIALLSATSFALISPAFSAQEDADLLNSYIGGWKGSGILNRDGNSETVRCKLTITDTKGVKVHYKGRCAVAGANFSIAGAMGYFEEKNRYEAVMTSSTSFSGVAIGTRNEDGIDFELNDRNAETGDKYEISSNIGLKGDEIGIEFSVTNLNTGRVITANIPFEK